MTPIKAMPMPKMPFLETPSAPRSSSTPTTKRLQNGSGKDGVGTLSTSVSSSGRAQGVGTPFKTIAPVTMMSPMSMSPMSMVNLSQVRHGIAGRGDISGKREQAEGRRSGVQQFGMQISMRLAAQAQTVKTDKVEEDNANPIYKSVLPDFS